MIKHKIMQTGSGSQPSAQLASIQSLPFTITEAMLVWESLLYILIIVFNKWVPAWYGSSFLWAWISGSWKTMFWGQSGLSQKRSKPSEFCRVHNTLHSSQPIHLTGKRNKWPSSTRAFTDRCIIDVTPPQGLTVYPWLFWNSLHRSDCTWTDNPASHCVVRRKYDWHFPSL